MRNKLTLSILMLFLFAGLASAELVTPGDTFNLPQLEATTPLDTTGTQRTYLYCTWSIGELGESIQMMDSQLCPDVPVEFTFTDDQVYKRRIDVAHVEWRTDTEQWQLTGHDVDSESEIDYELDLPEPDQTFFDNIFNVIKNILCNVFPGLGICS